MKVPAVSCVLLQLESGKQRMADTCSFGLSKTGAVLKQYVLLYSNAKHSEQHLALALSGSLCQNIFGNFFHRLHSTAMVAFSQHYTAENTQLSDFYV
ncbi:hypothetical protein LI328DRAFT_139267 [Trichoderma asperelloides]|nr:hypothetical protein LI328DRAFT_139267 [Trichoderma asperelloides]